MREFLSMGGYGAYVWPTYILSAVILGALTASLLARARQARRRLDKLERRDD